MRKFPHAVRGVGVLFIAAALACGGGSTGPGSTGSPPANSGGGGGGGGSASGATVTVSNNMFMPDNVTIPVGATVTFKWDSCSGDAYGGSACTGHTVSFTDGVTSDTLSSGTFSRSFSAAGTFTYRCRVHGTYMSGTIVVR
jgi:plastocyanin